MDRYDWSMVENHAAAAIAPLSDELAAKVDASPYSRELIDRALAVRTDRGAIEAWCDTGFPPPDQLEKYIARQEALLTGTLRARGATWADEDMLVDLWANAPETVGDWSVTVERGPNPYAQNRLQENPFVNVLEDHRVALGTSASSVRNAYIGGERVSVHFMSGWRIREGFRGIGLSSVLQSTPGPGYGTFGLVTYWFFRPKNASGSWMSKITTDMGDRPEEWAIDTDLLTATVHVVSADAGEASQGAGGSFSIRPTEARDLERCAELINRSHEGLDLFRPYSIEFLERRLEDPNWGPKPVFIPDVYGWPDHRVVEHHGEVVACAGMWQRGRDIREIWRNGDETHVEDPNALMDFGYASEAGADALALLIRSFVGESHAQQRSGLMAPLEFVPEVRARLDGLLIRPETRELHVMPFTSPELTIDATITRPYIDLAYW